MKPHHALLPLFLLTACNHSALPAPISIIKITFHLPPATTMVEVERTLSSRLLDTFSKNPNIRAVQTVSRPAESEIYIQIQSDHAPQDVQSILTRTALPSTPPDVSTLAGGIPTITPQPALALHVEVDHDKAAALGLSDADIQKAAAAITPGNATPEKLSTITLTNTTGQPIPLSAVARITTTAEPDCIVHKWP